MGIKRDSSFTGSSNADKRDASMIIPFKLRPVSDKEMDVDWMSNLSMVSGMIGVMLRYRVFSLFAMIFCISSIVNTKNTEYENKSILTQMLFAAMGIFLNYFGPRPV